MANEMKFDYDLANAVYGKLADTANALEDCKLAIDNVAADLETGALTGEAGKKFVDILVNTLKAKVHHLSGRVIENAGAVHAAIANYQEAENQSASTF
jgi:uncharacterized protein YukE